jgi:hypothetical protein
VLNDDELGEALRGELQARSRDINPSAELWERLGAIEQGEPSLSARPARKWSRRAALTTAAMVAAVFAVVAVVALSGSNAPPAFAVTSTSNGGVAVTLDDLTGVAGANARLSHLGVRARVVPMTTSCTNHVSVSYVGIAESPAPMIKLIPSEIAPTATIVLAATQTAPNHVEMAIGKVSGPAPSCVSLSGVGPGLPARPPIPLVHRSSRRS